MAKKGKVLQTIIDISGEISPTLGKTIDTVTDKLDSVNMKAVAVGASVAAIAGAAAVGFGKATEYLADLGNEYDKAADGMAASTGLVGEKLEALEGVMQDVYEANFGESFEDVADGVAEIYRQTKLSGDALEETTKGAFALRDAFGYDLTESARAAKAMMSNFGISGEDAMGMIAAGAQNGLDYSGELIDSISEYSVQFAKLGFSADEMFSIFQQGADNGAWNLDKVGDAIKEFSIRAIDGSDGTQEAFEALGLDAGDMMATFAAGGDDASVAFQGVLSALMSMDNEVQRDAIGVALMGTMWEDLGVEAVSALADVSLGAYDTEDALGQINAVKYDNLDSAMEGIKRQVEVSLLPAAESVQQSFMDIVPKIEDLIVKAEPVFTGIAEQIGPTITAAVDFAENGIGFITDNIDILIPVLGGLTAAFVAYKTISAGVAIYEGIKTAALATGTTVTGLASAATWVLNGALAVLTSPITLVVAAIAALVAAGIALYRNWDTVKMYAAQLGDFLAGVWTGMWDAVGNLVDGIKETFTTGFKSLVGIIKGPINSVISIVNGAINGINAIGFTIPDWVPVIGGKAFALNIPNIPMLAAGGFTKGVSIAGEAGTEAVISFDPAYREENLSYWARAGRMLGAEASDFSLGGAGGGTTIDMGGVTFAPNITVTGHADKESIMEAIEAEYPEFIDVLERWLMERGKPVYA